jgi:hypothetical protein
MNRTRITFLLFLVLSTLSSFSSAQDNVRLIGGDIGWTSLQESSSGGNHLLLNLAGDFPVQRHLAIRGQLGFGSPGSQASNPSELTDVRYITAAAFWSGSQFWDEVNGAYFLTGLGVYNTHESWALGGWSGSHTFGGAFTGAGFQWKGGEPALFRVEAQYHFTAEGEPDFWFAAIGLHLGI